MYREIGQYHKTNKHNFSSIQFKFQTTLQFHVIIFVLPSVWTNPNLYLFDTRPKADVSDIEFLEILFSKLFSFESTFFIKSMANTLQKIENCCQCKKSFSWLYMTSFRWQAAVITHRCPLQFHSHQNRWADCSVSETCPAVQAVLHALRSVILWSRTLPGNPGDWRNRALDCYCATDLGIK